MKTEKKSAFDGYVPFGDEYKAHLMKLNKAHLIDLFIKSAKKNLELEQKLSEAEKRGRDLEKKEIIKLTEDYTMDVQNCGYINSFNFVDKINFANICFALVRGMIYGK